ncbi:hypothetical protein Dda_9470 [Drechslerella dactyloides]|uniref:Mitochondrial division protein 1 n=1 Tax=Drechslerella dactyloides TaxID=74499 RepID=A0AAD6NF39_DREDA|nr:hypothetical protein Dda_9470 [Drechslerella dactyloides]
MATELKKSDYSVGWICAISIELAAVLAILDEIHPQLEIPTGGDNLYKFGRIGRHNIVIAWLPEGRYGITRAGIAAAHMRLTFTGLRFGLMVGVGGGAPSEENDIRLGDLVVSQPTGVSGGVVQYDFGKAMENGEFVRTGSLNAPPLILLSAVSFTKARNQAELGKKISDTAEEVGEKDTRFRYPGQDTDRLFRADYNHVAGKGRQSEPCKGCDSSKVIIRSERQYDHPYIHYGIIASGNQVMKDGMKRDRISAEIGALVFEMEAAGLMDDFPCLVIRGICDYSDGHKNEGWQGYSALVAAIYAKELILQIPAATKYEDENIDIDNGGTGPIQSIFTLPTAEGAAFGVYKSKSEPECLPGTKTDLLDNIAQWADDPQGKSIFWLIGRAGTVFSPDGKLLASASEKYKIRLWDTATGSPLRTLDGHTSWVNAAAFSPSDKLMASGSHDTTVKLWNTATGALLQTLEGHKSKVQTVAFSPDGGLLASGSDDKTIRFWNAVTGAPLRTLEGHTSKVHTVKFSPNGKILASASYDGTIRLWDVATGEPRHILNGYTCIGSAVAFSPDCKLIASVSGGQNSKVYVWDSANGVLLRILDGHTSYIKEVVFSADSKLLASASGDRTIRLWDTANGAPLRILEGHTSGIEAVAFSRDNKLLASASMDQTIRLWDVAAGAPPLILRGHADMIETVVFSPDGKLLASADSNSVMLWDTSVRAPLQTPNWHTEMITTVVFSPNGKLLASASWDGTVGLWNTTTGAPPQTLKGHTDIVGDVVFSPNGKLLASASSDRTVRLWSTATATPLQTLGGHAGGIGTVIFSPNGRLLASTSYEDYTAILWDVATGTLLHILDGHTSWVNAAAFSPSDKLMASGSHDTTVKLWNTATGALLQTLEGHKSKVQTVAFSPDGGLLASGSDDKTIRFWDAVTGAPLRTLEGHESEVRTVKFSPNGKILASASYDKTVKLWDTVTRALLQTLEGHKSKVQTVAFSPDGGLLASGSDDKTIRFWDAVTGAPLRTLEGHESEVRTVKFSPNGRLLASTSYEENIVIIWDAAAKTLLHILEGHTSSVNAAAFSPDGKILASASYDGTIRLWNTAAGVPLRILDAHKSGVQTVAFSPDGELLVSASCDATIRFWNRATGSLLRTLRGHTSAVRTVIFSPSSRLLASASDEDYIVIIWDAAAGTLLHMLDAHKSNVELVVFSPDGKTLASASVDNKIGLWDIATGALLQILDAHKSYIRAVAFSPNSKFLASASFDQIETLEGSVDRWTTIQEVLDLLEGRVGSWAARDPYAVEVVLMEPSRFPQTRIIDNAKCRDFLYRLAKDICLDAYDSVPDVTVEEQEELLVASKDQPAIKAEFGHPEVALTLTCLTYYYGGLEDSDLESCFDLLHKTDDPEGLNFLDRDEVKEIYEHFKFNKDVINFSLSELIFPREAKGFPHKLSTSGWDIAERKTNNTTGFSGTNDNRYLLPTSIQQLDLPQQLHTNSLVLMNILRKQNDTIITMRSSRNKAIEILKLTVEQDPTIQVLLDVGAVILERNNEQVATEWLRLDQSPNILGAVFFSTGDELLVMRKDGKVESFWTSALSHQLDRVLVYLDEAHTRGTDLKLLPNARAAVTLGLNLAKINSFKIQHGFPIWADQGFKYLKRKIAKDNFSSTENKAVLEEGLIEVESRPLIEMYGVDTPGEQMDVGPEVSPDAQIIQSWLKQFEAELPRGCGVQEEQERELDHELEEQPHIERPPAAEALEHYLDPAVSRLAQSGIFEVNESVFRHASSVFKDTLSEGQLELNAWPSNLFVTRDFAEAVDRRTGEHMDEYLRPVRWIMSTKKGLPLPLGYLGILALFSTIASAQRVSLPSCAQTCLSNAVFQSSCSEEDIRCLCRSAVYIDAATCCVRSTCEDNDIQQAEDYGVALCRVNGVVINVPSNCGGDGSTNTGAIVGGAVGGIAAIAFALLVWLLIRERRKRAAVEAALPPPPLMQPNLNSQSIWVGENAYSWNPQTSAQAKTQSLQPLAELNANVANNTIWRRTVQRRPSEANIREWLAAQRPKLKPSMPSTLHPVLPRGPPRKPKQSGHTLWVGNLPAGTTVLALKDYFAADQIESVFLILKSNCAFVNYKTEVACNEAMSRFHDSRFQGVRLVCRLPRTSSTRDASETECTIESLAQSASAQESSESLVVNLEPKTVFEMESQAKLQDSVYLSRKGKERYFIFKSLTLEDLDISVSTGIWATQTHNEPALNEAYSSAENVLLIFSANKSGEYYGYAHMASAISDEVASKIEWAPMTQNFDQVALPKAIYTPPTATAPRGRIIDDSSRGTIFWEAMEDSDLEDDSPPVEGITISKSWGRPFRVEWVSTFKVPFYRTRGLRNPYNLSREVKIARDGTEIEPSVGMKLLQMFHRGEPLPFDTENTAAYTTTGAIKTTSVSKIPQTIDS